MTRRVVALRRFKLLQVRAAILLPHGNLKGELAVKFNAHIAYDGECEAAFQLYQRVFGGKIQTMLRYGESPMADSVLPQYRNRIIHATLQLDTYELAGADVFSPEQYRKPQGFCVTINLSDLARAQLIFDGLAAGGSVLVPLEKTFWADAYAMFTDRFGAPWEINCSEK
jgi:PhnB protein